MHTWAATVDGSFQPEAVTGNTVKIPLHVFARVSVVLEIAEDILLPIVPEHRFAKDQSEGIS